MLNTIMITMSLIIGVIGVIVLLTIFIKNVVYSIKQSCQKPNYTNNKITEFDWKQVGKDFEQVGDDMRMVIDSIDKDEKENTK
jgi:hypothetical protein